MNIKFARDRQEIGEYPEEEVAALLASHVLRATDLFWHDGMPEWSPVASKWPPAHPNSEIQIVNGALKICAHTIFLRNVTSTRVEFVKQERKVTRAGFLFSLVSGVIGFTLGFLTVAWMGVVGIAVGLIGMAVLTKKERTYELVVVTSAGEVRALQSLDWQALQKLETKIAEAIGGL